MYPGSEHADVRTRGVEKRAVLEDSVERVERAAGVGEEGDVGDGEGVEEEG